MTVLPPSPFLSSAPVSLHPDAVAGSVAALVTPRCDAAAEVFAAARTDVLQTVGTTASARCEVAAPVDEHRFVLDEISFLEAIEQMPLFLQYRSVGYMR